MNKKYYVTFRWLLLGGNLSDRYAIQCPSEQAMNECGLDIYSINGIRYVYFNTTGKLKKNTTIIPYEDYLNGNYLNY